MLKQTLILRSKSQQPDRHYEKHPPVMEWGGGGLGLLLRVVEK